MKQLKILHAADLHLDSPFEALGEARAKQRRRELRLLPKKIRAAAEENGADLILLSGDLFDSAKPFLESYSAIESAFSDCPIPIVVSPGNHDYLAPGTPWDKLRRGGNFHVFESPSIECVEPIENVFVYGAAFTEAFAPNLLDGFVAAPVQNGFNILCLHADLGGTGDYCPISLAELMKSGMSYAALGHIHKPSGLQKAGDTWYAYPGCGEGRGFDECGARGALLITLSETDCAAEFIELAERRYEIIDVRVREGERAELAFKNALSTARAGDICRFVMSGESEAHVKPRLAEALAQEHGLFAFQLQDKTRVRRVPEGEDTLRGTLLKIAAQQAEGATQEEKETLDRALSWALAALDGGEEPWEVQR